VTKRSRPSVPPRAYSSSLHGRGRFFVGPGEEAVHTRKGQVGRLQRRPPWRGKVFSSTRWKKRSTRIEVSVDSSNDDPGRRVVLVDLISSGDDSGNNFDDDSDNNSGDDSKDHEASSETITQDLSLYLHIFTDQLF
jgi:hypothetical protein